MTPEVERAIAFIRHQQCDAGKIIADYAEFADKEIERLRAWIKRTAMDNNLLHGCYHSRRVRLEAIAILDGEDIPPKQTEIAKGK